MPLSSPRHLKGCGSPLGERPHSAGWGPLSLAHMLRAMGQRKTQVVRPAGDPNRGVVRWAWRKAAEHRGTFWGGGIGVPVAATIITPILHSPSSPTTGQVIVRGLLGLGIGVTFVVVVFFVYALLIAPYQQRNALRALMNTRATEHAAALKERDAITTTKVMDRPRTMYFFIVQFTPSKDQQVRRAKAASGAMYRPRRRRKATCHGRGPCLRSFSG